MPGAVSYAVQVGTDPYWSDEADLIPFTTVSTRLTLPVWLPHASYLWRVAAVGKDGVRGSWSATLEGGEPVADVTFTRGWTAVPAPRAQAAGDDYFPTFRWSGVRTASEYQIQVTDDPAALDLGPSQQMAGATGSCFTTRTSMTPFNKQVSAQNSGVGSCWFEGLASAPALYWRVRALDAVSGAVSEVSTTPVVTSGISTQPPAPATELDTSDCAGASDDVAGACEPAHAVEKGAWSAVSVWQRQAPWPTAEGDPRLLPQVVTAPLPTDLCTSAGLCRDVPTIDWDEVPGATFYRTYVALDQKFTNVQEISETPATQYTPTVQWRDSGVNASYYYAVQACTSVGCGPVTSSPPSYRKGSVPVPLGTVDVTKTDTVLRWTGYADALAAQGAAVSEAAAYRVQVTTATDPDFAQPLEDGVTDHTTWASPDKQYGEGRFLWRVQAVDASGHKLRWSTTGAFTRDTVAPTVASTSTLASIDPRASVTATLSEPVTGVSVTTAYLRAGSTRVPAAVGIAGQTVTVDPTATLPAGGTYELVLTSGIHDLLGNALKTVVAPVTVVTRLDDSSKALTYTGTWSALSSSMVSDGTYRLASAAGATVSASTSGTGVRVYGCRGPSGGRLEVRVDGVLKAPVDTYRSYSSCGTLVDVTGLTTGSHVVQVKVLGTRASASKGTGVGFAGLRAL